MNDVDRHYRQQQLDHAELVRRAAQHRHITETHARRRGLMIAPALAGLNQAVAAVFSPSTHSVQDKTRRSA